MKRTRRSKYQTPSPITLLLLWLLVVCFCRHRAVHGFLPKPRRGALGGIRLQNTRSALHQALDPNRNDADSTLHETKSSPRKNGFLVLLTVPLAWGTFEPAVRYVYELQPEIPPFLFQLVYYLIATSALVTLALQQNRQLKKEGALTSAVNWTATQGGFELGTYLFIGNALQVVGLKSVPSDRAAFLLQLTTIFVPLVQSAILGSLAVVPWKTWLACFVALSGVLCIGLDGSAPPSNDFVSSPPLSIPALTFSTGDAYIVTGALLYSFHCIRLERYAKSTPAVTLAAAKATTETLWSAATLVLCLFVLRSTSMENSDLPLVETLRASGQALIQYQDTVEEAIQAGSVSLETTGQLVLATTWTGLITIAYTIFAQSYGQSTVSPSTANLIYTLQPLFTAVIAFLVLGETLSPAGYLGGLLIGGAVFLVIQSETVSDEKGAM